MVPRTRVLRSAARISHSLEDPAHTALAGPPPGDPHLAPSQAAPFLCHLRPLTDLPNSPLTPLGRGPPAAPQEPPGQPQEPSPPSDAAKFSLCTCTQGFPGRGSQLCHRPPPCRGRRAAFTVSGQSSERPWPQSLEDQDDGPWSPWQPGPPVRRLPCVLAPPFAQSSNQSLSLLRPLQGPSPVLPLSPHCIPEEMQGAVKCDFR